MVNRDGDGFDANKQKTGYHERHGRACDVYHSYIVQQLFSKGQQDLLHFSPKPTMYNDLTYYLNNTKHYRHLYIFQYWQHSCSTVTICVLANNDLYPS